MSLRKFRSCPSSVALRFIFEFHFSFLKLLLEDRCPHYFTIAIVICLLLLVILEATMSNTSTSSNNVECTNDFDELWLDVLVPCDTYNRTFITSFRTIEGTPKVRFRIPFGCTSGSVFQVCIIRSMANQILAMNHFGYVPTAESLELPIVLSGGSDDEEGLPLDSHSPSHLIPSPVHFPWLCSHHRSRTYLIPSYHQQ